MKITEKLTKEITETKYLSTENSYRYRPIMRCFYRNYEELNYWLYKEDVYNELKDNTLFDGYTLEDCERDLENLAFWGNLSKMQDTKNASTIEEFKNKKNRYQLTETATEIERLTISLEEMEIKTSSLEPKLFDRIRTIIKELALTGEKTKEEINDLWSRLNEDFTKLNQNYQDYLKKFNDPKTEELLQSVIFLQFKNDIIKYLREFIMGYQRNRHLIKDAILALTPEIKDNIIKKLTEFYKSVNLLKQNFDENYYQEETRKKFDNILAWFFSKNGKTSEGEKLIDTTNNIIVIITKYASALIELHGNNTSRKEEYKHLAKLFDKIPTTTEAHKYASVIFGIGSVRHFAIKSNINTDTITNSYDIPPVEILLSSRAKGRKEKVTIVPIQDKTEEKMRILEEYRAEQELNKKTLRALIKDMKITLDKDEVNISKIERRYIQKLISAPVRKESEFGLIYDIKKIDGMCKINSEDGTFYMNKLIIEFEGDIEWN